MNPIYMSRINLAIDYIQNNLHRELSLDKIAEVACFSKYHFHRIFKGVVSETLNQYIRRARLEKSASYLIQTQVPVTEIAYAAGFSSPANFARDFKEYFHISPSQYRKKYQNSKNRKVSMQENGYILHRDSSLWESLMDRVEIKELPDFHIAYLRSMKGYNESVHPLWDELNKIGYELGLINGETKKISVLYDYPGITDRDKCRYDACFSISDRVKEAGPLSIGMIRGGKFAVLNFYDHPSRLEYYYDFLYGGWFPESNYEPLDCYGYQIHYAERSNHNKRIFCFDICIPIKEIKNIIK